jgi:hypothetical protein
VVVKHSCDCAVTWLWLSIIPVICFASFCFPSHAVKQDLVRSLADIVRWKNPVERSTEEKEWIAIDRVMFPECYMNLPGEWRAESMETLAV